MDQLQSPQGQGDSEKIHNEFLYPQIKVIVDDGLGFIVKGFSCSLPDDHPVYIYNKNG